MAFGAPLTVAGTQPQIVAALPGLARQMARRLGARQPRVPTSVSATPGDMTLLGQVPWKARRAFALPPAQEKRLRALGPRLPLAAVLLMRSRSLDSDDPLWQRTLAACFAPGADNAIVASDASRHAISLMQPHRAAVTRFDQRFPNNYLLATCDTAWHGYKEQRTQQRQAAERAVRCAPRNGQTWVQLANVIYDQANDTRRGRFISRMSRAELAAIQRLYPEYLRAALQATRLDAGNAFNWLQVSKAAAFNGESELSDAAFMTALRLAPKETEILDWGLQLYRPKWQGDQAKLLKLVAYTVADPALFFESHLDAVYALRDTGLAGQAQSLLLKSVAVLESTVRRDPNNALAHKYWANLARNNSHNGSKDDVVVRELQAYVRLRPYDADDMYDLGSMLHYKRRQFRPAEAVYRRAIALRPDYAKAINSLGDITYYVRRDAAGAEKLYRRAIALEDDGLYRVELSRLLLDTGRRAEALQHAQRAITLGYDEPNDAFDRLGLIPAQSPS